MMTKMIGDTAKINKALSTLDIKSDTPLTPTNEGKNNDILFRDLDENDDQFLEHEQSLCCHPHHRCQCEVVKQY